MWLFVGRQIYKVPVRRSYPWYLTKHHAMQVYGEADV
jgi:hypothetical protein